MWIVTGISQLPPWITILAGLTQKCCMTDCRSMTMIILQSSWILQEIYMSFLINTEVRIHCILQGPSNLKIDSLEEKVKGGGIREIIFALSATMEGDTTNYYLFKRLNKYNTILTTLARGVAIGDELEYIDEITLGRAINNRNPYQQ